jgi:hypothetical protein
MGFMVLSRFHTLDHRFHRLVIVDPGRFNTPPSQYFIFKKSFNISPFNYFKSIFTIIHQIFNFQMS